jgi:1-acyl-sn-glycerol-3-phosphate acyltransferase
LIQNIFGTFRFIGVLIASLLFAITAIMTIPISPSGRLFHANSRAWARVVLFLGGIRVQVSGLEKLDLSHNSIYVANHASFFDIPSIVAGIPDQIRIVYKKELERIPVFGWGLKWGSYIGIDRRSGADALESLEEAAEKIRRGASVLLYAEGTRTLDGKLQPFKRGAFHLAVKAGVPVVPLTINGSFNILRKHSIAVHPGTVELVLEPPIKLQGNNEKDTELKLMKEVHAAIRKNYIDQ